MKKKKKTLAWSIKKVAGIKKQKNDYYLFSETEVVFLNALPNLCMLIVEKLKKNLKRREKSSTRVTLNILV